MKTNLLICLFLLILTNAYSQNNPSDSTLYQNSSERILLKDGRLKIGGYGQVQYLQAVNKDMKMNGQMDVDKLIMLFGYRFDEKTQLFTEIEFEHVNEVYVEQFLLDYRINRFMNLRTGLILIPMGFINEYHEPVVFNGVERPVNDNILSPTTWREIGAGFTGNIIPLNVKYQAYILNGFNSYDTKGRIGGNTGLRGGRQKGSRSFMSSPTLSVDIDYYGFSSLNAGLSLYTGKTQSSLFNNIDRNDTPSLERADSSRVGITFLGSDLQYLSGGLDLRAQLYFISLRNSEAYNSFTNGDLGKVMTGLYAEAAFNVLHYSSIAEGQALKPFIRFEMVDTHFKTEPSINKNPAYTRNYLFAGLGWWLNKGAVLKADVKLAGSKASDEYVKTVSLGMGVSF